MLSGDFGAEGVPRLIGFEAFDPMQHGPSPGANDVLRLRFDRATDMGGLQLNQKINKGQLEKLFVFHAPGSNAFANAFGALDPSDPNPNPNSNPNPNPNLSPNPTPNQVSSALAMSIDYSLFLLSRFSEEAHAG